MCRLLQSVHKISKVWYYYGLSQAENYRLLTNSLHINIVNVFNQVKSVLQIALVRFSKVRFSSISSHKLKSTVIPLTLLFITSSKQSIIQVFPLSILQFQVGLLPLNPKNPFSKRFPPKSLSFNLQCFHLSGAKSGKGKGVEEEHEKGTQESNKCEVW